MTVLKRSFLRVSFYFTGDVHTNGDDEDAFGEEEDEDVDSNLGHYDDCKVTIASNNNY